MTWAIDFVPVAIEAARLMALSDQGFDKSAHFFSGISCCRVMTRSAHASRNGSSSFRTATASSGAAATPNPARARRTKDASQFAPTGTSPMSCTASAPPRPGPGVLTPTGPAVHSGDWRARSTLYPATQQGLLETFLQDDEQDGDRQQSDHGARQDGPGLKPPPLTLL